MVNHFEENGVRVLLPYLPWDQGTRNTGQSDVVSLIDVIIRSNCSGKYLTFQIIIYSFFVCTYFTKKEDII